MDIPNEIIKLLRTPLSREVRDMFIRDYPNDIKIEYFNEESENVYMMDKATLNILMMHL